jgi:hypothetical protein
LGQNLPFARMKIEHIAIWARDLEKSTDFCEIGLSHGLLSIAKDASRPKNPRWLAS